MLLKYGRKIAGSEKIKKSMPIVHILYELKKQKGARKNMAILQEIIIGVMSNLIAAIIIKKYMN